MMTKLIRSTFVAAGLVSCFVGVGSAPAQLYGQFKDPLPMIQRSVLNDPADTTGVPEGKMGSIAYDPMSQCMYFAATRSGVLVVEDPAAMARLQVIRELNEPMGVAVAADLRKVVLTCGDGSVRIYKIEPAGKDPKMEQAGRLTFEKSVANPGEADQVRYDAKTKRAFYGHGKFLSWVTPEDGAKCPKSIELPGPTKGIVIEPGSDRMFVSIQSKNQILVIDRAKWEIIATWQLKDAEQPCPLALDDMAGRLFVACRNPTKLLVLDAKDGKELDRQEIGADCADCWWDPIGRRVYASWGGGTGGITMIWDKPRTTPNVAAETARLNEIKLLIEKNPAEAEKFAKEQADLNARVAKITAFASQTGWFAEHQIDTAPGARTSVFVPEKRRYIVCAPKFGDMPTFVYIYVLPNVMEHNEPMPKSH